MAVAELSRLDEWINQTLRDDAALVEWADGGIWGEVAPQGTTGNLVLSTWQAGVHRHVRMGYALYLIRAVAEGESFLALEDAADRIDTQLVDTIPKGGVMYRGIRLFTVQRMEPHQQRDDENGIPVVYLGNVYRFWFSGT